MLNLDMNKVFSKLNDPRFAQQFSQLMAEINSIPNIQQTLLNINSIKDPKKQEEAMKKVPGLSEKLKRLNNIVNK